MMRLLFLLFALLSASVALAQSDPARAKSLYEEAKKYFEASQYKEALALFQESYTLSEEPSLLFNIGQCYRLQQQCNEANDSFRRFLQKTPAAPNRAQVERLITECPETSTAPSTKETTPTSAPVVPSPINTASLTFTTRHKGASYQVSVETTAKTFRCVGAVTASAPCLLPELPPGDVRVVVGGSRSLSKELSLSLEESTFEIEQRGYAVPIAALSAPAALFFVGTTGALLSGAPTLDSLGVGAALGALTALIVTPSVLLIDRFVLPPHKSLRKTLSQKKEPAPLTEQ